MTDSDEPYHDFEGIVGWDRDEARTEPVDDDRCVWCKWPRDEWDDDVEGHEIDTGEVVCSNCLADQRAYKRKTILSIFYPGHWFDDETLEELDEHTDHVHEAVTGRGADWTGRSNATGRSNTTGRTVIDDE